MKGKLNFNLHVGNKLIAVFFFLTLSLTNKAQTFSPYLANPFSLESPSSQLAPAIGDLDSDGDLDIMCGANYSSFFYFENIGTTTSPDFAPYIENPFSLESPSSLLSPAFVDLDNDGDLDIMCGANLSNFYYFENIGTSSTPDFAEYVTNPFSLEGPSSLLAPEFADLDNDGDLDLMCGANISSFYFYENIGTINSPDFAPYVTDPFSLDGPSGQLSPSIVDLDKDGDLDILCGATLSDFYYFENVGTPSVPNFAEYITNPFSLESPSSLLAPEFADLDDDADMDILCGANYSSFYYYENSTIQTELVAISKDNYPFQIAPNPCTERFQFSTKTNPTKLFQIEFYDITGNFICAYNTSGFKDVFNISELPNGIYFLKLLEGPNTYSYSLIIQ